MDKENEKHLLFFKEGSIYHVAKGCVAILLATYNGEKYLEEQLESLRKQTVENFVCFIHDDGSTDKTSKIIESYSERYVEHFVHMGSVRKGGVKYNFMYMLKNVEAEYYMFCDQDDVWMPYKIEKTYRKIKQIENETPYFPACVFSDAVVVDEELNIIKDSFYVGSGINPDRMRLTDLLYQNTVLGCTMMFNRLTREMALQEDVSDLIHMHDWFLALIVKSCGKIERIKEPFLYYRQHEDNASGAQNEKSLFQKIKRILKFSLWLDEKKEFFKIREDNAKAVLACIDNTHDNSKSLDIEATAESYDISLVGEKINSKKYESINIINKFLKRQNTSLIIKLMRFYRWKMAKM